MTGLSHDDARERRRDHPGHVGETVLQARPFAGGRRTGNRLRDGPVARCEDAVGHARNNEERHRSDRAAHKDDANDERGEGEPGSRARPAHARGSRSCDDGAIGQPAGHRRGHASRAVRHGAEHGHFIHGKTAFVLEVGGQPREQEIPKVVAAKMSRECRPCDRSREDFAEAGAVVRHRARSLRRTRHPSEPRGQPQQAAETEDDEDRTPAMSCHEHSASEDAERGAELGARVNQAVRESALPLVEMRGDDFGIARVSDGLAHTEQQPEREQQREGVRQASRRRRQRPHEKAEGHHPFYRVAIHEPAGRDLEQSVGPEKCGEQPAIFVRRHFDVVFQQRSRSREAAAIDVVDGDGHDHQRKDRRQCAGYPRVRGVRVWNCVHGEMR